MQNLTQTEKSLMGLPLAIFLGFRNSASYDRYWEARKHWGLILIECRNLSRRLLAHLAPEADMRRDAERHARGLDGDMSELLRRRHFGDRGVCDKHGAPA